MFTLRADGRYMGHWHDLDRDGKPKGTRHAIYDRDPERLYQRIQEKETPKPLTLRVVEGEWETLHEKEIKARTWSNYAPHIEAILAEYGDTPIDELTAFEVNSWLLAAKAKGYSYTVVSTNRSIWNMIFDYAVGQRYIPYNPAASVKMPKGLPKGKRKVPEDEVLNTIIGDAGDLEFGFIPFFLLCTGLRRTEALQRPKSDINTKTWEIEIPRAKTDAGVRTVPIITPLREPLKKWMEAHPGEWLFPYIPYNGRKGDFMTDANWETAWVKYCGRHGWLDDKGNATIGAHNLRHGTATLLYESGVDVYVAQHILGHASIKTTMEIYTELRKAHERKNVGKFSRSMAKRQTSAAKNKKAGE